MLNHVPTTYFFSIVGISYPSISSPLRRYSCDVTIRWISDHILQSIWSKRWIERYWYSAFYYQLQENKKNNLFCDSGHGVTDNRICKRHGARFIDNNSDSVSKTVPWFAWLPRRQLSLVYTRILFYCDHRPLTCFRWQYCFNWPVAGGAHPFFCYRLSHRAAAASVVVFQRFSRFVLCCWTLTDVYAGFKFFIYRVHYLPIGWTVSKATVPIVKKSVSSFSYIIIYYVNIYIILYTTSVNIS